MEKLQADVYFYIVDIVYQTSGIGKRKTGKIAIIQ